MGHFLSTCYLWCSVKAVATAAGLWLCFDFAQSLHLGCMDIPVAWSHGGVCPVNATFFYVQKMAVTDAGNTPCEAGLIPWTTVFMNGWALFPYWILVHTIFFLNFYKKKCALDSSKYSTVPGSRYIKLKVDHEIVQFIDNTKHKICLSEVNMRTLHIWQFPRDPVEHT